MSFEPQSLLWILLVPLLGAIGIALANSRVNLREGVTLFTACVLIGLVFNWVPALLDGQQPYLHLITLAPGLEIALRLEPLGMLFACLASGLWLVNSVYSIGYMRGNQEKHQTRFYICFAIALSAAMGIAMAENLLTLFIFYEVLTLSTYPLVAHKGNENAKEQARVYLGILLTTSIGLLLPAMFYIY
ncbi:MAG: proton-conducting transporter membrane subunit, partial [Burkholderiaceae bacterium]